MYEDLDAPLSNNWPPLSNSVTRSGFGGPTFGPKRTKCNDANEKNLNWPLREYT
jgi:hypothetical protein